MRKTEIFTGFMPKHLLFFLTPVLVRSQVKMIMMIRRRFREFLPQARGGRFIQ